MSTATITYRNYAQHLDRSLEAAAKSPQVIRESGHYLSHIVNVKSIDDFMSNKRVLQYALTAFGLSDISYATALVRRLLEGGIDDASALANRFTDQRYRDFVTAFNFARYGDATTAFDRTQQGTVDRYKRQILEQNVGQQSEGARLALYFQRQAPNLTSPLGLLADVALLKVTQTALSLSPYTSNLSIEAQRDLIANRVNIAEAGALGRQTLAREADQFAASIRPMIEAIRAAGNVGLGAIAGALNARGVRTARGGFAHVGQLGVLGGEPLFACQYKMARGHWQIAKQQKDGGLSFGGTSTIAVEQAPPAIIETAVKCARLIGDGLYGIDLKQNERGVFVIEINDNPNLDTDYEDSVLKDELYRRIIEWFAVRLEKRMGGAVKPAAVAASAPAEIKLLAAGK